MPSAKVLESKKQQVASIAEKINGSVAGVLVSFSGTTVEDDTQLRADLRKSGVYYTVIKNTLLKRAIEGTSLESLSEVLEGTTAIALSADDSVVCAKILSEFADKHDAFKVKGGYLDGEVISLEKIDSLAKLPSKEVLLATVAAAFQAPMSSFARAINAIVEKDGEAAEETADEKAEDAAPAEAGEPAADAPAEN